jgi:hypothetical protein
MREDPLDPFDSLSRRKRTHPTSTDKRVTPQERDLLWFQKIHRHGPLSSSYLHAFSKHLRRNEKRAKDRLTDLFNESRTPHGGAYLSRPSQQFRTLDSRYNELVRSNRCRRSSLEGTRVVARHGDWSRRPVAAWLYGELHHGLN